MTKAIVTVDLGFGDASKGATVDFLCRQLNCKDVVRYSGGHQAGHNVVLPDGTSHTFSQFGAGTLAGARTWLERDVIIEPHAMFREAEHLMELGIKRPFEKLHIHEKCAVTTRYHRAFNRAINKLNGYGTCGLGIGMTRLTALVGCSINIMDSESVIVDKMFQQRAILEDYYYNTKDLNTCAEDRKDSLALFLPDNIYYEANILKAALRKFDTFYTKSIDDIEGEYVIFEASQGLALNEYTGYNAQESTWGNVSTRNALELVAGMEYHVIGLMRPYISRHGGTLPFVPLALDNDPGNPYNEFQGKMNFYLWTIEFLEKQIKDSGCDSLSVSHLDQMALDWNTKYAIGEMPINIRANGRSYANRLMTPIEDWKWKIC